MINCKCGKFERVRTAACSLPICSVGVYCVPIVADRPSTGTAYICATCTLGLLFESKLESSSHFRDTERLLLRLISYINTIVATPRKISNNSLIFFNLQSVFIFLCLSQK